MAYIDTELHNARLIWTKIRAPVLVLGLIAFAMTLASVVSALMGHVPHVM